VRALAGRRNTAASAVQGAYEVAPAGHYFFIVLLHSSARGLWALGRGSRCVSAVGVFLALQIRASGSWRPGRALDTRIIGAGAPLVKHGPYRS